MSLPDRSTLLPTDTNEERPSRARPRLRHRDPESAALRQKPDCAGVGAFGAQRGIELHVVGGVQGRRGSSGRRSACPRRGTRPATAAGGATPSGARLGEPGGDHKQRPHAGGAALARDSPTRPRRGIGEDREIGRPWYFAYGSVRPHPTGLATVVDRVHGATEAPRDKVSDEPPTRRRRSSRRTDDRDGTRREESRAPPRRSRPPAALNALTPSPR